MRDYPFLTVIVSLEEKNKIIKEAIKKCVKAAAIGSTSAVLPRKEFEELAKFTEEEGKWTPLKD